MNFVMPPHPNPQGRGKTSLRSEVFCRFKAGKRLWSRLSLNFVYSLRSYAFEKFPRPVRIEFRVTGLDAEKESVTAGQLETIYVENRMVRHRQTVQCQDTQERR